MQDPISQAKSGFRLAFQEVILLILLIASFISFFVYAIAEEYTTHSAGYENVKVDPFKDAIIFCSSFIIIAVLFLIFFKFQKGHFFIRLVNNLLTMALYLFYLFIALISVEVTLSDNYVYLMRGVAITVSLGIILVVIIGYLEF